MLQIFFCCVFWTLILLYVSWGLVKTSKQAFSYLHRLHQIPYSKCAFFTGDYRLKCTVHPITAMSEEAINCCDFVPKSITIRKHYTFIFTDNCYSSCQKKENCTSDTICDRESDFLVKS